MPMNISPKDRRSGASPPAPSLRELHLTVETDVPLASTLLQNISDFKASTAVLRARLNETSPAVAQCTRPRGTQAPLWWRWRGSRSASIALFALSVRCVPSVLRRHIAEQGAWSMKPVGVVSTEHGARSQKLFCSLSFAIYSLLSCSLLSAICYQLSALCPLLLALCALDIFGELSPFLTIYAVGSCLSRIRFPHRNKTLRPRARLV